MSLLMFLALLVMMEQGKHRGKLYQQMILFLKKRVTYVFFIFANETASTHFHLVK